MIPTLSRIPAGAIPSKASGIESIFDLFDVVFDVFDMTTGLVGVFNTIFTVILDAIRNFGSFLNGQ